MATAARFARALWQHRLIRYIVAGSINTGISQLLYLAGLAAGMTPGIAFACAFVVGIAIGYALHSRIVFVVPPRFMHWWSFPAACLARLAISEWLLHVLIDEGLTAGWAGLVVNVVMVPIGYLLTRAALTTGRRATS